MLAFIERKKHKKCGNVVMVHDIGTFWKHMTIVHDARDHSAQRLSMNTRMKGKREKREKLRKVRRKLPL